MTKPSPGQRAVELLEIDDIFLVESNCRVRHDFNQTGIPPELGLQYRSAISPSILLQTRTLIGGADEVHIVRYLVTGELRVVREGVEAGKSDLSEDEILAELKLTFAADYRCEKSTLDDKEALGAFGRNALFHVWPYLREAVHTMGARMRLPRITVPMMRQAPANSVGTGIEPSR